MAAKDIRARPCFIILAAVALIVISYFFIDRGLAAFLRPHLRDVPLFIWLTYIADPLTPLASICVALIGLRAAFAPPLSPVASAILRISIAVLVAGTLTHELKGVFGRTWPETWVGNNPSYFGNGTYGFFPFHGGRGYASFPSGHTTVTAAFAASLWFCLPMARWIGVLAVALVAIGLLGADYHWLSDIIAGATIGGLAGWAAATIGRDASNSDRARTRPDPRK